MGDFWTPIAGSDADAIHDNVAGEISAVTEKTTPVSGDLLLIEDSAASNVKKRVQVGNLPGGSGGVKQWVAHLFERQAYETAHADDQFWGTGAPAAPAGGTAVTPSPGVATWLEGHNLLSVNVGSMTTNDIAARVYPLTPTTFPVTVESAVRMTSKGTTANGSWIGVGFTDGAVTTSKFAAAGFVNVSNTPRLYEVAGTIDGITTANLIFQLSAADLGPLFYLRCVWTAANTFENSYSADGVNWTDFAGGSFAPTMTPTDIMVFCTDSGQGAQVLGTFEYLRVYESDLSA